MPSGIQQTYRQSILNYFFKGTAIGINPAGVFQVGLHTGAAPTSGNEVGAGVGYTPFTTAAATFNTATAANPSVTNNQLVVSFGTATGAGWGTVQSWGLWLGSGRTAADLFAYGTIPSQAVPAGATPTFAATQLFTQLAEV